jgi:thiol-disulfide isomerase/thioredoxin
MSNRTRPTKSAGRAGPAPAAGQDKKGLPIWIPIGIVAAVVLVIVIALVASGGDDEPDTVAGDDAGASGDSSSDDTGVSLDLAFGQVQVSGDPLPPRPPSGDDPAIGMTAPGIRGFGPDSVEQVFANGAPRAIALMAHWCGHCQNELDSINAYLDGGGTFPSDVEIQTIATWSDSGRDNFPPGEWLADNNWDHRTIVDDEDSTLAVAFGLSGTPMWVFVDADGTVVERTGALDPADLAARMAALAA